MSLLHSVFGVFGDMEVFNVLIPNCPDRQYTVAITQSVLDLRMKTIRSYFNVFRSNPTMHEFEMRHLLRVLKYSCEDLITDSAAFTPEDAQSAKCKLLAMAHVITSTVTSTMTPDEMIESFSSMIIFHELS